jgi:NADPH:quinone reductase-like Zn-dependent oxidoreductase
VKALVADRYGDNSVVRVADVPKPALRDHDVLLEMHAASVNPIDFKIRAGKLKTIRRFEFPLILGCDGSGVVSEVGPAATRFKEGDEVFVRFDKERMGAFAEFAVVDESLCAPKPKTIDHHAAAAVPLVGLTSWQALVDLGRLEAGQRVFIPAGSGGVGTIAIQIAKHRGATVATTTSAKNTDLVRSLGADVIVDYTKDDFARVIEGQDLVFETMGGEAELRSLAVLKRGGAMVGIAGLPDAAFAREAGMNAVVRLALRVMTAKRTRLARRLGVRYTYLFMRPDGAELALLGDLVDRGVLKPIVDRVFPLAQAADALAYLETGRARGKVVLAMK